MSLKKWNEPLDRRILVKVLALLAIGAIVLTSGWQLWRWRAARSQDAASMRTTIHKYLAQQSGVGAFKALDRSSNSSSNAPADSSETDADAAGKKNKPAKLKKKSPPSTDLARRVRGQIEAATEYKAIYRIIGESLTTTDELLASKNSTDAEMGLALAADMARAAHDNAMNDWLGARIAEAYLWPGLEFAASKESGRITPDFLLNTAEDAFREAGETNNLVRNYRFIIAHASKPGKADNMRFRAARLLEEQGDFSGALALLREVQDTNNSMLSKRITALQKQLNAKVAAR